jgi:hypothetical protein
VCNGNTVLHAEAEEQLEGGIALDDQALVWNQGYGGALLGARFSCGKQQC